MTEMQNVTTYTSICMILLRELRMERGVHQAQVADWIGKTPSAWTKVEAGKSPLQFETFVRVCFSFQVQPSTVMATAERYAALLRQHKWAVLATELDLNEDGLLRYAQEYWASPGCRNSLPNPWGAPSVLNGPLYNPDNTITLASAIRYALDANFRAAQLNNQVLPGNALQPEALY
ncbi:helix-turn-helix domain-containing protein [Pseudomonas sp. ES3-33]|uniref:helix-turn-helix domain-containing protein n=1 Tax=Pseudomonas sp. ES3-33 TaxID=1628833 RepID=UPI000A4F1322|nr:helix-turn-helix transcriptional regulator [Pseudomonas sp. ES3-33]